MKKYWCACEVHECPVCGHEKKYRYRVYDKPAQYWQLVTAYDWCDAF